jgi:hypothetical protein
MSAREIGIVAAANTPVSARKIASPVSVVPAAERRRHGEDRQRAENDARLAVAVR